MTFVVALLLDQPERVADDMQRIRSGDSVFRVVLSRGPGELRNVNNGLTSGGGQCSLDDRFQCGGSRRRLGLRGLPCFVSTAISECSPLRDGR